ncbi:MAG: adaptor protein MecA [Defluviitaleaceae bacterium]|nr:adaptor protein MecA [Defluviitaleaceae bacterium]
MKIERISDNQIKFTLTEGDLSQRNMRLHELSYGSEKAQELFREIMERATVECDFHTTQETPLIIEAIPVSRDGIMIIVTKVANPEDLEDRFGYPPVLGNYKNIPRTKQKKKPGTPGGNNQGQTQGQFKKHPPKYIIFEFASLDNIISACARISGTYIGDNTLFKHDGKYYLTISVEKRGLSTGQESVLKEYGNKFSSMEISKMFLTEHSEVIITENAVGALAHLG